MTYHTNSRTKRCCVEFYRYVIFVNFNIKECCYNNAIQNDVSDCIGIIVNNNY